MYENVVFCSGGKDSVATLIAAKQHGEPLDAAVFCEVMFDKDASGEHPLHRDFVFGTLKPFVEQQIGVPFIVLRSSITYMDNFHHIVTSGSRKGCTLGFPIPGMCNINKHCKLKPIREFLKAYGKDIQRQYVGIAADEPIRLERLTGNKVSLLAKYGITEKQAKEMCEAEGLLSPIYEISQRNGCWFCPNCRESEWVYLLKNHPELFDRLVKLEQENPQLYRQCLTRTETPTQLKQRLEIAANQLSIFE